MCILDHKDSFAKRLGTSNVTEGSEGGALIEVNGRPPMGPARASQGLLDEGLFGSGQRCIRLSNIVREYHTAVGVRRVLDGISFEIKTGEKIAILGKNGAGKSTLVRIIGGVESPTSGEVTCGLFMSWPIGFSGGFDNVMSGLDNIRFIARLYAVPFEELVAFVDDFAELGRLLYLPVKTYSSGMRARLAFGLTLAVNFECFLIDEVIAVGDARFRQKCYDALFVKRRHCAMILVSHDEGIVREYCNKALVMKNGRGRVFNDIDFAFEIYRSL
jgi:capsular polysaccharide transport system ATP-binding protein